MALAQKIAEELEVKKKNQQQAGLFARYIQRMIDNLQVTISNIHVRLEDHRARTKMCIGVTLQELKLRTIFRKAQKEIASSESSDQNEESNPDSIQDD